ncbi:MAG TPA: molybdopterin cofactor-binding domain-containing protein [Acetobacteraceae bacterium]|nr:molybdopterin cofactor-binding domain-containing protein [Acetobacteraceae bacterium]
MSTSTMMDLATCRRTFLAGGGALVVNLLAGEPAGLAFAADATATKSVAADDVDGFLAIDAKGLVTVYSGKVDLGTGVHTGMMQIVAEELDVPMSRVTVIEGDTALTPDQGPTYGSLSIQKGGMQIRQAAATARRALTQEAAKQLGAAHGDLMITDGVIRSASGKSVSYADLIGGKLFALKLDPAAPVKDPKTFRLVGTPVARVDIPAKVTAQFTYMQDVRVPNMLHGRVVRPPAVGATLQSVDEGSVRDIPGVVKVVHQGSFLGVVAETEWAAIKASRQLKATWSAWDGLPDQNKLWEHVRATKIAKEETTSHVGDAAAALAGAAKRLKATYDFTIHTHGSIGPSCAIAELRDGKLTCWTASQATHNLRKQLAAMLSMPAENVRAIYVEGSGCYGRNGHEDAAADATLLARAVGKPVRVQWMREDEHGWDPKGPPTLIDLEAALDASGNVLAWSSQFFIPEGAAGNVALLAAEHAGLPHETTMSPGSIHLNAAIPYAFPNVRTTLHRLADTPFRPSWIRTPGRMQNTFANEGFLDELAVAAGSDPLAFRLRSLKDPRGVALLARLASLAKWETRTGPSASSGDVASGRGVSYVKYELARTYVGAVADVDVNRKTGEIAVTRFFVVHDCGQIINPDGVRSQLEGNIIQTISRTLMERVTFNRSRVTSTDWASYPILRFPQVPEIHMELIDRPTEPPWGAGEPAAAVVSAAISNAVHDATGARLRSVPFTPDKVKAAMPA